ncbi:hypothetical protein BD410DRAFT_316070 [Rickenella mellea]|uniref:Uncharacterized protein n=1 Tax=Rickenella mellea TaxID=50990 RepID=A0A4Y7Q1T3_9AGAM|nr:hypothetical protein BD410DRAFT_316070 [Rickenella mellea]
MCRFCFQLPVHSPHFVSIVDQALTTGDVHQLRRKLVGVACLYFRQINSRFSEWAICIVRDSLFLLLLLYSICCSGRTNAMACLRIAMLTSFNEFSIFARLARARIIRWLSKAGLVSFMHRSWPSQCLERTVVPLQSSAAFPLGIRSH